MNKHLGLIAITALLGCNNDARNADAPETKKDQPIEQAAIAPAKTGTNTVVDIAVGSKDHTTLVAALRAAELVGSLASPGGVYTVFAPTNAAFEKLPKGTVEGLLMPKKKADLTAILKHHAAVPMLTVRDMRDGESLSMADGTKVTFHVKDGKTMVNDVNIVASIVASNGIVHVVDGILLPAK